jgi:hypothetical protein
MNKQETLEEAAKEFVLSHDFSQLTNPNHLANRCFQYGAEWQAERMYSEEDMKKYASYMLTHTKYITPKEWFEQFKKK